jgi:BlaI family transcriptional regulator, penicillinase repressor
VQIGARMNEIRLHEGELNIMELLWSNKVLAAKDISKIIKEYIGWEKNTTYTVIKRLIEKGAIKREDPGFLCKALISKRTVQITETKALLNKFYNGSLNTFLSEYLKNQILVPGEILELERIISEQKR